MNTNEKASLQLPRGCIFGSVTGRESSRVLLLFGCFGRLLDRLLNLLRDCLANYGLSDYLIDCLIDFSINFLIS